MPRSLWRGEWYIYNHVTRKFLCQMRASGQDWTRVISRAHAYKNPSQAQKCAARINAILKPPGSPCFPCQPVSVVTGEAARCLDQINLREGYRR